MQRRAMSDCKRSHIHIGSMCTYMCIVETIRFCPPAQHTASRIYTTLQRLLRAASNPPIASRLFHQRRFTDSRRDGRLTTIIYSVAFFLLFRKKKLFYIHLFLYFILYCLDAIFFYFFYFYCHKDRNTTFTFSTGSSFAEVNATAGGKRGEREREDCGLFNGT